jgi:hypothetical protein
LEGLAGGCRWSVQLSRRCRDVQWMSLCRSVDAAVCRQSALPHRIGLHPAAMCLAVRNGHVRVSSSMPPPSLSHSLHPSSVLYHTPLSVLPRNLRVDCSCVPHPLSSCPISFLLCILHCALLPIFYSLHHIPRHSHPLFLLRVPFSFPFRTLPRILFANLRAVHLLAVAVLLCGCR